MTTTKTKSRRTYVCPKTLAVYRDKTDIDGVLSFASVFEAKVYALIRKLGLEVSCQSQINLTPGSVSRYKKPLTWKVDFFCWTTNEPLDFVYIEAKGDWIKHNHAAKEAFRKTLRMLETAEPIAANNLIVVSSGAAYKIDELHTTVPFRQLADTLKQKFPLI